MATGSGLDAQIGFAEESVFGTIVTPSRFYEFNDESLAKEHGWVEPTGLAAGRKYKLASRLIASRTNVTGSVTMEHSTRGMGLLWKHALGSSTVTQIGVTPAYEQIHIPGALGGKSLTVQVGRPEPSTGTVRPFTYSGVKITSWTFSINDNETGTLELNVDGRNLDTATALAVASYVAGSGVWGFERVTSLKLGGTASTASGKTSVSGGVAATTIINGFSVTGEAPRKTDRYGLGSAGLKAEQLENDVPTVTGSLEAEFSKVELFDVFNAKTTIPLQLLMTGNAIGGGENDILEITFPAVKLKTAAPQVGGPDVVMMSTDFEAYSDGTNPVVQVRIVSADTAV